MIQRIRTADLELLQAAALPRTNDDALEAAVEAVNRAERNAYDALGSLRDRIASVEDDLSNGRGVYGQGVLGGSPVWLERALAERELAYQVLRHLAGPDALRELHSRRVPVVVQVVPDGPRRCGIHGDDTTSGRCASCDRGAGK